MPEAFFVPEYGKNLISMSNLKTSEIWRQRSDSNKRLHCSSLMQEKNLFAWSAKFVNHETQENEFWKVQCLTSSNLKLWHDRLGHIFQNLIKLQSHDHGMKIERNDSSELKCDTYELYKAKPKPVPKDIVDRANNAFDFVHVDILGTVTPVSVDNHEYAISFVDSFSRYWKIYFMKRKFTRDECLQYFQQFCADLGIPQTLVIDCAKEFSSSQILS